jgi:hypothetical protein
MHLPLTIQLRITFTDEELAALARKLGRTPGTLATKAEVTSEMTAVTRAAINKITSDFPPTTTEASSQSPT